MFRITSYAIILLVILIITMNIASIYNKITQKRARGATDQIFNECDSKHTVRLEYSSLHGTKQYSFYVSLHDPSVDTIISKGILTRAPKYSYPSVDQIHAICEHIYSINCSSDKIFVEAGSAIGMVSLYAASRGMRVFAVDVLLENVRRLNSSICVNNRIRAITEDRISILHNFASATGSEQRTIESEPGNLAATMRGGGMYRETVKTVTIDSIMGDNNTIELLLLTCQGFEYEALLGSLDCLESGRIRNIVWRRHYTRPEHDAKAELIALMLLNNGYRFYNIEEVSMDAAPRPINQVLDYVMKPRDAGEHPNIFASIDVKCVYKDDQV